METYKQKMHCENCGETGTQNFDKGTSCKGYFECCYCGCLTAKAIGAAQQPAIRYRSEEKDLFTQFRELHGRNPNKYELIAMY